MSKWNCDLFEVDISQYTYIELAEWIIKCRQVVLKSHYDTIEEYQNKVYAFCDEWEEHYRQNQKIYRSEKFKKAILFIGRKDKFKFLVDFGNGKEDVSNTILTNTTSSIFFQKASKIAISTFNEDIIEKNKALKECFSNKEDFKIKLNELICKFYFNKTNSRIRVFKYNKWFKSTSYKEFLKECEKIDNYEPRVEPQSTYSSYLKVLEDYDIAKTTYLDYMSIIKAEIAFEKKIFINLAFVLSLPYDYAEKLLNYNGFSFKDSIKIFDIICEKAFRIGYSRDYVIALIDKYSSDMKKKFPSFTEIKNITKSKR